MNNEKNTPFSYIKNMVLGDNIKITEGNLKDARKARFLHFCSIVGIIVFSGYSYLHFFVDNHRIMAVADIVSAVILVLNLLFFRFSKKLNIATSVALYVCFFLFLISMYYGGYRGLGIIWVLLVPLVSFFLKGKKEGIINILIFMAAYLAIFISDMLGLSDTPYDAPFFLYVLTAYIVMGVMAYFYEDTNNKCELIIKEQIITDALTGLPNREQLIEDINSIKNIKLILFNIDDFKAINDLYGYKLGDMVLIEAAKRLSGFLNFKLIHNVYKLHADEYGVLLKNVRMKKEVYKIIEDLNRTLTREMNIDNIEVAVRLTYGIADRRNNILADADMALKEAKEKRRHFIYFDKSMKIAERFEDNIKWLSILKRAITHDNIVPYFQPIVNNRTGLIEKYECLMRLIDKEHNKVIPPLSYLDIAKKSKIYSHLTKIMILKAMDFFKTNDYFFSVNLCMEDIVDNDTVDFIFTTLKQQKMADRIIFEIVESEKIETDPKVNQFIFKAKEAGCKIAIDDFGTGYSNFDYILQMNIDFLKIDASLIKNIDNDENSRIITETIVDFTKKLGIKTIAEFVHSKKVYNKVKELDIDYSQGFFLGKPEPELVKGFTPHKKKRI